MYIKFIFVGMIYTIKYVLLSKPILIIFKSELGHAILCTNFHAYELDS